MTTLHLVVMPSCLLRSPLSVTVSHTSFFFFLMKHYKHTKVCVYVHVHVYITNIITVQSQQQNITDKTEAPCISFSIPFSFPL